MIAKTDSDVRKPPLLIDAAHSTRLEELALAAMRTMPAIARALLDEVERADLRPADQLPSDIVQIGSEVTYEDDAGAVHSVRLVFPENANLAEYRLSVLTPIGAALIGLAVGQTITWRTPDGQARQLTALGVSRP